MDDHIVTAFGEELQTLGRKIAEMGGVAEFMVSRAARLLEDFDRAVADHVVATDARLDALQREIDQLVITTLARRQPFAGDLREVVVALRISSNLERVGDLASSIGKRASLVAGETGPVRGRGGLRDMARAASLQLKDVLDAYARRDAEQAKAVWLRDADLDALEHSVFRDLLSSMAEDPRTITLCTHLLFCSKNLERIGDHATNIAEDVNYLATGAYLPLERPKGLAVELRQPPRHGE